MRILVCILATISISASTPGQDSRELTLGLNDASLASGAAQSPVPTNTASVAGIDGLAELDLVRLEELCNLTAQLGDELWPGFDAAAAPLALNIDDHHELLIGHSNPPSEYQLLAGPTIADRPVLIREGVTQYGPRGGGWMLKLAGEGTVYVMPKGGGSTERYLSLLLHEAFHVFQQDYRKRDPGPQFKTPVVDVAYSARLALESHVLHAALTATKETEVRELARMFIAVRHARRADLAVEVIRNESEAEYSEGTAKYIEARLLVLAARRGGIAPKTSSDPAHNGFADAERELQRLHVGVLPAKDDIVLFDRSMYQHGMAQGLLLDQLRPAWKQEIREPGATQFLLLERSLSNTAPEEAELLARAEQRFDYAALFAQQQALIDAELEHLRSIIEAPGRRYRIYHGALGGSMKWQPDGPLHIIPDVLLDEQPSVETSLWEGGIRHLERPGLVFESGAVPMIYRRDYLEWIDTDPAADNSDLVLNDDRYEGDVHIGLELVTDGFTLKADRARVVISDELVQVFPLVPDKR